MENKNWQYYGVFFGEKTKNLLFRKASQYLDLPFMFEKYHMDINSWKKYCDHVTIVYNDGNLEKQKLANNLEILMNNGIGAEESMYVSHMGVSNHAIAFKVDYPTTNKISHVTVAVAPGAKPVESNYITDWEEIDGFYITGRLNKITKK